MFKKIKTVLSSLLVLASVSSHAAITGVPVQCVDDTIVNDPTIVINNAGDGWATPTSGNLLTLFMVVDGDADSVVFVRPSGFTAEQGIQYGAGWFRINADLSYKVSDGTETTFTVGTTNAPSDHRAVMCEWDMTDLSASIVGSAENEDNVGSNTTSQATGSASSTETTGLALGFVGMESNTWTTSPSWTNSFVERYDARADASTLTGAVIASKVLSASGSQTTTYSATGTGTQAFGAILVLDGAVVGGETVTLSDATPTLDTTVTATLSAAFGAGGNATKIILSTGDEATCTSTSTTCDFTLARAQMSNTGSLNNTNVETAYTLTVTNGTETSQSTAVNIQIPATALKETLGCTAGTNCQTGSEAQSPMASGDTIMVNVNNGDSLADLTTHGQPYFNGPTSNYDVHQYDSSATAWLEVNTVNMDTGGSGGQTGTGSIYPTADAASQDVTKPTTD